MTSTPSSLPRHDALSIPEGLHLPTGWGTADLQDLVINYARVSTDEQGDNNSLSIQHADGRRYATRMGWTKVLDVADEASGTTLERPGLRAVRALIRQGRVRALIVHATDRLTRSLVDLLLLRDELVRANVELHYAKRGKADASPSGILLDNIEAVVAQYERTRLLERMADGRRGKVESGRVPGNGPPPFGYRYVGREKDRALEIDEEEAEIVRLIFIWYVVGDGEGPLTASTIAQKLAARGVKTRADKNGHPSKQRAVNQWNPEFIRNLLHNTTYYGVFYAYRYRKTADKRDVLRPKEEWVGVNVPAIVSKEVWDAAQQRLARGRALSPRNSQAGRYLLRCRMRCECGYAWVGDFRYGTNMPFYVCSGRKKSLQRVHTCSLPYINGPQLDGRVWEWIESEVLDEDALKIGLSQYQAQISERQAEVRRQIAQLEEQRRQHMAQLDKLVDLFLSDGIDRVRYDGRRAEITAVCDHLTQEIEARETQTANITDEEIAALQGFARAIREELRDLTMEERRRVVDMLDVRVTIMLEEDVPVAHVRCRLSPGTVPMPINTSIPPD